MRRGEHKGAKYAIEAAKIIKTKVSNVNIVSFGNYDGYIPDFIQHKGFVSETELAELMGKAKIVILPSIIEGFSLVGIEAMKSGAALISTYNRGVEEYVKNKHNGVLVKPRDAKALAEAAITLLRNNKLRIKLAKEGMKTVKKFNEHRKISMFLKQINQYEKSTKFKNSRPTKLRIFTK